MNSSTVSSVMSVNTVKTEPASSGGQAARPQASKAAQKPTCQMEIVGKAKAEEYLAMSQGNRRTGKRRLSEYVSSMKDGKWVEGVATVDFDVNGRLVNGHHVLQSIVESGKPQFVTVRRNLAVQSIEYFDLREASRSERDRYEFIMKDRVKEAVASAIGGIRDRKLGIVPDYGMDWLERNYGMIEDIVKLVNPTMCKSPKDLPLPAMHYVAAYMIVTRSQCGKTVAERMAKFREFWDDYSQNRKSGKNALREATRKIDRVSGAGGGRTNQKYAALGYLLQAWNKWLLRKTSELRFLNLRHDQIDKFSLK